MRADTEVRRAAKRLAWVALPSPPLASGNGTQDTFMAYKDITPPEGGKITITDGNLQVPDNPVVPFIRGDGTGPDIWAASQLVFDAAIEKAYGGAKQIAWFEVFAGQSSKDKFDEWLPDDTVAAFREYLVGIKGPLTTPVGGGIRSINVALRQILDLVQPDEDGAGAARAVRWALEDAGTSPAEVDYINAHGTSTPLNDAVESLAIKRLFGDAAYQIPVSSTKSMTGHLLGSGGALEASICVMAMRDSLVPPTINLEEPDLFNRTVSDFLTAVESGKWSPA